MGIFSKPAVAPSAVFDPVAFKAVLLKVVKAYSNNRSTVKRSIWITILVTIAIRIHGMSTAKPKKIDKKTGLSKGDGKAAKVAVRCSDLIVLQEKEEQGSGFPMDGYGDSVMDTAATT